MQELKDRIRKGIKEYPNIPTIRTQSGSLKSDISINSQYGVDLMKTFV
jgi:hypothetical protein